MSFRVLYVRMQGCEGYCQLKADLTDWTFGVHSAMLDQAMISRRMVCKGLHVPKVIHISSLEVSASVTTRVPCMMG
jgi:hypothetical protein